MKRLASIILVTLLILCVTACHRADSSDSNVLSDISVGESSNTKDSQNTTTTITTEDSPNPSATAMTNSSSNRTTTTSTSSTGKTTQVAASLGSAVTWEKPTTKYESNKFAKYIDYRTPLTNTYNKLTKDNKLTVAYIGGSLTNGSGVVKRDEKSWRGLTGQWLEDTFPKANITNINAAVGATGSMLGLFRLQNDVIKHKPDLLFVEFAINDQYYDNINTLRSRSSFETLIREARQSLPYCDIVVLITTDQARAQKHFGTSGSPHTIGKAHMAIAESYGISVVNIADAFINEVAQLTGNSKWFNDQSLWRTYFTDEVHPRESGYAMWFNYIKEYLENSLLHTNYSGYGSTARKVPSVQSSYLIDGNRQSYIGNDIQKQVVTSDGEFVLDEDDSDRAYWYHALERGDSVTLKFTGTQCAIWTKFENVEFKISYTVDGKDNYTLSKKYSDPYFLISGLQPGTHTIKITHDTDSKLKSFGLRGFFMRDETQQTSMY